MFLDYQSYLIFIIPAMIFSLYAQYKIMNAYRSYSRVANSLKITGADAAREILNKNGVFDVEVKQGQGQLSDHYDPREKVIRLSPDIYNGKSISAVSIAAHEVGHALQDAEEYLPLRLRSMSFPLVSLSSFLAPSFIYLAMFSLFVFSNNMAYQFLSISLILFLVIFAFHLITLPVEINASTRALDALSDTGILQEEERKGAGTVLKAAALTYVAAVAMSLANVLRIYSIMSNTKRND